MTKSHVSSRSRIVITEPLQATTDATRISSRPPHPNLLGVSFKYSHPPLGRGSSSYHRHIHLLTRKQRQTRRRQHFIFLVSVKRTGPTYKNVHFGFSFSRSNNNVYKKKDTPALGTSETFSSSTTLHGHHSRQHPNSGRPS